MDLTLKAKSWAGKAYHRFESICKIDTRRFLENQVQSVATRFYSNMVPDVHPPSKDDDRGITVDTGKQLSQNQGRIRDSRKSDASLDIGVETHVQGLIAEDHKDDSNLEDPNSDETGSRPNITVSKAHTMGSPDYSTCDVDWTLCDVSSEDESFHQTRAVDVLPDLLILQSNGITFSVDESDFVGDFSGKGDIKMIPSETDTDTMHLDMETIDLSPDMKHDETIMILNGNSIHDAFRGKRNFRYYKKLIQDALTSRQRLSKEYEHLAILHGGIESESSNHFVPIFVPSSTNTSVHVMISQSFHEMSETEWELV